MEISDLLFAYRMRDFKPSPEKIARDNAKERKKTKGRKSRWNKRK